MCEIKKKKSNWLIPIVAMLLANTISLTAVAQEDWPKAPERFYGNVTINGRPAPDGTLVSAWINGVEKISQATIDGKYGYVPPATEEFQVSGSAGDIIIFKIYDVIVGNDTLNNGGITRKDLSLTDTEPPSKVTGLSVKDAKDGKLSLTWDAATDNLAISYYKIYRNGNFLINCTGLSYQDTGLTNGQSYSYQVSAVDIAGNEGDKSDPKSGTPTATSEEPGPGPSPGEITPPVDNPPVISDVSHQPATVTSIDNVTITAVVTDDNAITSVDLYWNDGTLHSKAMTLQTGNTYSATIGPFTAGTTVTYYIQAVDNAPQATTSDTYSFTVQNATQPSSAQPEEEKTEKPEEKPAIVNLTIDTITAGETKNISLKEYGLPIEGIKITATNNVTNVKIKVEKLTQKPANITKPPSEKIYIYLNIEENINESDIASFTIKFKVEKTWITNNNIDKNMILLMRYHNGSWQELPTTLVKEDETNVYYEATMTGFSIFAIAVKEKIKISPFSWIIYIAITAITLAIIAIIIILYKKKVF